MKKMAGISLFAAACLLLNGCGEDTKTDKENLKVEHAHNIACTVAAPENTALAENTLDELVGASDFVGQLKVTGTEAFYDAESGMIRTNVTAKLIDGYKGEYNGETIQINGGYMPYEAYQSASGEAPAVSGTLTETSEVFCNFMDVYVPEEQDLIVVFCQKDEDGVYQLSGGYQGMFQCVNVNGVINQALIVQDDSTAEPLALDLIEHSLGFFMPSEGMANVEKTYIFGIETSRLESSILLTLAE